MKFVPAASAWAFTSPNTPAASERGCFDDRRFLAGETFGTPVKVAKCITIGYVLRIVDLLRESDNESHLLASDHVTIEEVEDVVLGVADEDPDFDARRDGPNYVVMGETGSGRLLTIALEPVSSGCFRPFAARDVEPQERRTYRSRRRRRR